MAAGAERGAAVSPPGAARAAPAERLRRRRSVQERPGRGLGTGTTMAPAGSARLSSGRCPLRCAGVGAARPRPVSALAGSGGGGGRGQARAGSARGADSAPRVGHAGEARSLAERLGSPSRSQWRKRPARGREPPAPALRKAWVEQPLPSSDPPAASARSGCGALAGSGVGSASRARRRALPPAASSWHGRARCINLCRARQEPRSLWPEGSEGPFVQSPGGRGACRSGCRERCGRDAGQAVRVAVCVRRHAYFCLAPPELQKHCSDFALPFRSAQPITTALQNGRWPRASCRTVLLRLPLWPLGRDARPSFSPPPRTSEYHVLLHSFGGEVSSPPTHTQTPPPFIYLYWVIGE